jgi:type IV pilus assembly protein PilC
VVVDIREGTDSTESPDDEADDDRPSPLARLNPLRLLPPTALDVETGLRQLAAMLDAGLTLLASLKIAADQSRRPRMAAVWEDIRRRVEGGSSFADALAAHPRRIPPLAVQLARAGEQSGTLPTVLDRAADQLERRRTLVVTLANALIYPAVVTLLAVTVGAYLALVVVPELRTLLEALNREIPPITQLLLDVSAWCGEWAPMVSIGFGAVLLAAALARKNLAAARMMDRLALRVPVVGKLLRIAGTASFARGLGMLLENGVTLADALSTAGGLTGNTAMAARAARARDALLAGGTPARALRRGGEFLPMLGRMAAVGEETGRLPEVLARVAAFHEAQLAAAVRRFSVLIEPVMTLVVGGIVGFVYLAFFMAMYSFAGSGR